MKEISVRTEITTLETELEEKETELGDAIQGDEIFEKTKKLYLEMKALHDRIDSCLQSLNPRKDATFYQHGASNLSLAHI